MSAEAGDARAPALLRRMACFLYEAMLLFGVLMLAGWLYSIVSGQRHALVGRGGLQAVVFVVLGAYFGWFWAHGGQTLAMKAWRIRVVTRDGAALTASRALVRYLLAWAWFVPALAWIAASDLHRPAPIALAVCGGIAAYALSSRLHPSRQFWHDVAAGTRLIDVAAVAGRHNRVR